MLTLQGRLSLLLTVPTLLGVTTANAECIAIPLIVNNRYLGCEITTDRNIQKIGADFSLQDCLSFCKNQELTSRSSAQESFSRNGESITPKDDPAQPDTSVAQFALEARLLPETKMIRTVSFNGKLFPLEVSGTQFYLDYAIRGLAETPCLQLHLKLTPQKGVKIAKVNKIAPHQTRRPDGSCWDLYRLSGNDLIKIAESIATASEIDLISLNDASRVSCMNHQKKERILSLNDRLANLDDKIEKTQLTFKIEQIKGSFADLRFVRMFARGQTWYGSHGYYPYQITPEIFEAFMESYRKISLTRYFECLGDLSFHPKLAGYFLSYQRRYPKDTGVLLKDFMTWVFRERCEDFDLVVELLLDSPELNHNLNSSCSALRLNRGTKYFRALDQLEKRLLSTSASTNSFNPQIQEAVTDFIIKTPYQ